MSWLPRKTVVVPVDFSDESLAAVAPALELADRPSSVHVVHVLSDLSPAEPGMIWDALQSDNRRQHANELLRERLHGEGYRDLRTSIEFGDPGYHIVEYAQQVKADLIVMPSHGRTGLKRVLIGSVAERVLRLAHCPVLILRQ